MKTLEELFKELNESKELQAELQAATDAALEAFLKQHGCEATAKEFFDFAAAQEGELSDDEAANAAGGYHRHCSWSEQSADAASSADGWAILFALRQKINE